MGDVFHPQFMRPAHDPDEPLPLDALKRAGSRIAEWRRRHGKMTQHQFCRLGDAEKDRLSRGTLQTLEAGSRVTTRDVLERCARKMNTTVEQLLAEDNTVMDPRLTGLMPDDIEVAYLFQRATGPFKVTVQRMLREHFQLQQKRLHEKGALSNLAEAAFPRERRGGVDRRTAVTPSVTKRGNSA